MKSSLLGLLATLAVVTVFSGISRSAPQDAEKKGAQDKESTTQPSSQPTSKPAKPRIVFETTKGKFVVEVTRDWSPIGADRFVELVKEKYFDDVAFFRVVKGFVVQFGLNGDPAVTKKWQSKNIKDDPIVSGVSNVEGTLVFAKSGMPNSRTTQLFINLANNGRLDSMGFTPFAKVIEGMNVVKELYAGYGDGAPYGRGPDQGKIGSEGNPYLKENFPMLDYVKTARLVE